MKVCKVIWSTNRLEYLIPTLKSQRDMLDFSGCEVHGVFIDDMPKKRHDGTLYELAKMFGYDEVILHQENHGIARNWNDTFKLLSERDYDYVYHSEDDVLINQPIKITDLIEILSSHDDYSQICLSRQKWYDHEPETQALETDEILSEQYRGEINQEFFWSLASFYARSITNVPYSDYTPHNLSEFVVAECLKNLDLKTCKLKTNTGENLVTHIGDYSIGKRLEVGDPGWEKFSMYDPDKKYDSRYGNEWR
jgi:hypothetical protein